MARQRNRTGPTTRRPRTAAPRLRSGKRTLRNGLKVVAVEMPHVHSVSLVAYVRAGSRYETPTTNGMSHFLEHMFFRGTERFPSTYELAHHIESLGATFNATTTREMAYFYTEIAPRHLESGVETLGEMFRAPLFPDIGIEREVVLEEMSEDYNEDGVLIDPDSVAKAKLWPGHPLGFPIIGLKKNVKRFREADLRAHHRRLYSARNTVLCAAGDVSLADLARFAERHLGFLPPGTPSRQAVPEFSRGRFHLVKNPDNQLSIDLVFPAFREQSEDWKTAILLRRLLDDGISSRLHRAIVDRGGLAYGCEAILDGFHDTGTFEFECTLAPEKLPVLIGVLTTILSDLKTKGPDAAELARVKERYACDLEFAQDSTGEMAGWHGGAELFREPELFADALAKVRAVSAADIKRVANRLFDPARAHLIVVGEPSARDAEAARKKLAAL